MINAKKLGLAGGVLWGFCMLFTTILSMYTNYAHEWLMIMSGIYPGYTISWWGSLIGMVYGFLDVGIGLFLLAWLYNKFTK